MERQPPAYTYTHTHTITLTHTHTKSYTHTHTHDRNHTLTHSHSHRPQSYTVQPAFDISCRNIENYARALTASVAVGTGILKS